MFKPVGQTRKAVIEPLNTLLRVDESLLVAIEFLEHKGDAQVDGGEFDLLVHIEDFVELIISRYDVLKKCKH